MRAGPGRQMVSSHRRFGRGSGPVRKGGTGQQISLESEKMALISKKVVMAALVLSLGVWSSAAKASLVLVARRICLA